VAGGEPEGRTRSRGAVSCDPVLYRTLFISWHFLSRSRRPPAGGSYHISPQHVRRFGIDEKFLIETHFPNRERIRAGRVSAFNGRSYQNYPTVQ
jgi:hypothetical protein